VKTTVNGYKSFTSFSRALIKRCKNVYSSVATGGVLLQYIMKTKTGGCKSFTSFSRVLLEQKVRSKNEIKILNYIKTFKKNNK
jgi:hypothetical protein